MVRYDRYPAERETGGLWTTMRRNPVPAGLAAIGLSLLWTNRAKGSQGSHRSSYARYGLERGEIQADWSSRSAGAGSPSSGSPGTSGGYSSSGGSGGSYRQSDDQGQPIGEQVMGHAQQMGGQVQDLASQAMGQAGQAVGQVPQQMQQQAQGFWQMVEANPVAVAALGGVLGGVTALLLPETQTENQLLGETRDRVVSTVQEMAGDTVAKVQLAAEEAGTAAMEAGQAALDELNVSSQDSGETGKSATGKRDSGSGTST